MLPDVFTDPRALGILTAVILALVKYQRSLGYYEYRTIHRAKVVLAPLLDRWMFSVSTKGRPEEDAEYLDTVMMTPVRFFDRITADRWDPHLANSVKRRPSSDGDGWEYSYLHFVEFHDETERQTELYVFVNGDGTLDIYGHNERWVQDPEGHMNDTNQQDGDPRGVLPEWVTDAR